MSLASNQALVGLGDARGIRHVLKGHAMAALTAGHESRQVLGRVGERASLRIVAFLVEETKGREVEMFDWRICPTAESGVEVVDTRSAGAAVGVKLACEGRGSLFPNAWPSMGFPAAARVRSPRRLPAGYR